MTPYKPKRFSPSNLSAAQLPTLLVAVTSLVTSTITAGAWWLYHASHTNAVAISASTERISVYVWNTGRDPSVILSARLRYASDKRELPIDLDSKSALIPPSGQSILELKSPAPTTMPSSTASLLLRVQESNGDTPDILVPLTPKFVEQLRKRYCVTHGGCQ